MLVPYFLCIFIKLTWFSLWVRWIPRPFRQNPILSEASGTSDNCLKRRQGYTSVLFKQCFLTCLSHTHCWRMSLILLVTPQGTLPYPSQQRTWLTKQSISPGKLIHLDNHRENREEGKTLPDKDSKQKTNLLGAWRNLSLFIDKGMPSKINARFKLAFVNAPKATAAFYLAFNTMKVFDPIILGHGPVSLLLKCVSQK